MYCDFWNLTQAPFNQRLDQGYFFESEIHEEALARLLFIAEEQKKCGVLSGPAGTGKTLTLKVFQQLLKRTPHQCEFIDLIGLGEEELLWQVCASLRLGPALDTKLPQLWRQLSDYLIGLQLIQGRQILLLDHVDQARTECISAIERLLHVGNQQFPALSLVLTLDHQNTTHVDTVSRLSDLSIELDCFERETTESYITSRLSWSGCQADLFTPAAYQEIQVASQGIPEKINQICDLALLAGFEQNLPTIDADVIKRACHEIKGTPVSRNRISEVIERV
ncbi:ExeA family protein [Gimesia sp.]|uniref:ExeA family protein n=1 Tax=Gimesia sp. TaxID=2024833 RepID=UPI003A8CE71D